ncbi:acyltransferase-like protein [Balneicella halophila]|uniref:Acyltransferase-like protein n=1 Tax=Balneicella halophila TaxID=1537566 RepID=A0A7L4UPK5_BALHA|nr:1-acyl-sn-glycerol-3-phosphate acyltransferase [Balneicella halophila]PVX50736.1 acyltransferase-like protein [Balneicella halophila]
MTAWIAKLFLKLNGWKFDKKMPEVKKAVILSVPHTSNWDFVWGKLSFLAYHIDTYIFLKKELFFFPLNLIFRALNVLPIDRTEPAEMIKRVVREFDDNERFYLCITPEGTRSRREKWPRGFYYIAAKAKVPIYLGRIDYKKKELSLGELFYPTGNIEKDVRYIKSTYRDITAKHPEKFSLGADA